MDVNCGNVESLSERIAALVAQRQELRSLAADPGALERNRLEIAYLQWELARALIVRYHPGDTRQAA